MTAAADRKAAREAAEAPKADADVSPPAAVDATPAPDAPDAPAEAPTGELHTYRALRAMGGVGLGREFEATPDDARVLSGYVTDLGPVGTGTPPDAVQEALDGQGDPAVSA